MNNLNLVVIEGNLTKDVELKHTESGKQVGKFSIACNKSYYKYDEKIDTVSFFNVTCWEKVAETCNKFLSKGSTVIIEGELKQESWEDKDGSRKSNVGITALRVHFRNKKAQENAIENKQESQYKKTNDNIHDYSDDDIPF